MLLVQSDHSMQLLVIGSCDRCSVVEFVGSFKTFTMNSDSRLPNDQRSSLETRGRAICNSKAGPFITLMRVLSDSKWQLSVL